MYQQNFFSDNATVNASLCQKINVLVQVMIAIKSKLETKSSILSTVPPPFVPVSLDFLAGFPKPIEALSFGNCIIHNLHYWVISG